MRVGVVRVRAAQSPDSRLFLPGARLASVEPRGLQQRQVEEAIWVSQVGRLFFFVCRRREPPRARARERERGEIELKNK